VGKKNKKLCPRLLVGSQGITQFFVYLFILLLKINSMGLEPIEEIIISE